MTSNTRRPGFRLWGGDSADEPEEQQTGQQPAAAEPAEATSAGEPATGEPAASEPAASAPDSSTPATSAPAGQVPGETTGFLASLVSAMRSVAEEARDSSLTEFRSSVEQRITELQGEAADRTEDLRRQADADIGSIGDWQRSEMERIKAEAEQKTEARRTQLDRQISDHRTASEQQVAAIRTKLAEHEQELTSFFAELAEIHDPGAFVAAAKRMPRPPQITDTAATSTGAPRETLDMRLAALGVERSRDATSVADEATGQPDAEPATEAGAGTTGDAAEPVQGDTPSAEATPEPSGAEPSEPVSDDADAQRDEQLADRLAQLDTQLAGTPGPETAPQNGVTEARETTGEPAALGETSTAIVVKGLGSFGAITSFKQALERVDGILGVTLSLGPTGEFVYRASHAPDFDLVAAVRSVEGPGAEIERGDGQLRVSVNRNR